MGLGYWNAEASEKEALREQLKALVENHESFLLDEQLRDAADAGISAHRQRGWDARTDCVSVQVGSAAFSFAQRPFEDWSGDAESESDAVSHSSTEASAQGAEGASGRFLESGLRYGDREASFAQLFGPALLLSSVSAALPPSQTGSSGGDPRKANGSADTEGAVFYRVLLCFASATAEMQALVKDAYAVFIPPLALFGDLNGRHVDEDGDGGGESSTTTAPPAFTAAAVGVASYKDGIPTGRNRQRGKVATSAAMQAGAPPLGASSVLREEDAVAGVAQLMKGHLQELWAWQQRALTLAVYTLRQLAALFSEEHCESKKSPYLALVEVRYAAVWHALTDLLGALTAVEEILQQNENFKTGYVRLRKILAQLITMAADASESDSEDEDSDGRRRGGTHNQTPTATAKGKRRKARGGRFPGFSEAVDADSLRTLQSVVVRVGDDLLRYGKVLRVVAERTALPPASRQGDQGEEDEDYGPPYEPKPVVPQAKGRSNLALQDPSHNVRYSPYFRRELLEVLDFALHNIEDSIDTPKEGSHHRRIIGVAALYQVCCSLFKLSGSNESGVSSGGGNLTKSEMERCLALGKRLFTLHHRVPIVHVQGAHSLSLATWLGRRMPREVHTFFYDKPAPLPFTAEASTLVLAATTQETVTCVKRQLQQKAAQFPAKVKHLTILLTAWLCDMRAMPLPGITAAATTTSVAAAKQQNQGPSPTSSRYFIEQAVLLIQRGLRLALDLQFTITTMLTLLQATRARLPISFLDSLVHATEMLMMVREAFHAKSGVLASSFDTLTRSIAFIIEKHLHTAHVALYNKLRKASAHGGGGGGNSSGSGGFGGLFSSVAPPLEQAERCQLRAIEQAMLLFQRPLTPDSLLALSLLLDVIANRRQLPNSNAGGSRGHTAAEGSPNAGDGSSVITVDARDSVFMAFAQLTRVVEYQVALKEATSCELLYWIREAAIPRMFERLYQRPVNAVRLPYLAAALEDAATPLVMKARHTNQPQTTLLEPYEAFVRQSLEEELLHPLCADIEDNLRLCTHGAVLGQPFHALEPSVTVKDLASFTRLAPFKLFGRWCDIAARVEDHLDAQFYNLNALMPNDWKIYEEMRSLALEKYGLSVAVGEGSLPGGIMDQGLDVLVITEDIQLFIAHYTYNLNEQLFIQRPTSTAAKHLHTLHTRHIANSIRTHGTGIMNTTVNYVYKCLLKKLSTLSRFLADDHVKSRLIKDQKWVAMRRRELRNTGGTSSFAYPLSRAKHFNQEMRKLGLADDGHTFLAKFARLVSEIGNALGYMRMIRSGGLRAIADSAQFLPQERAVGPAATEEAARGRDVATSGLARHLFLPQYLKEAGSSSDSVDAEQSESRSDGSEVDSSASSSSSLSSVSSLDKRTQRDAARRRRKRQHLATIEAIRSVDRVVQSVQGKLSDGSAYFALLLDAVGAVLGLPPAWRGAPSASHPPEAAASRRRRRRQTSDDGSDEGRDESNDGYRGNSAQPPEERYAHLHLFHLIVPPMCLTFVEEMIRQKEQLVKKANDALFTDDGFALGCVFVMTLFGVQDQFHSLHFFEGTREDYVGQLMQLHQTMMERQGLAERVAEYRAAQATTTQKPASPSLTSPASPYTDNEAGEVNNMHLTASMLDITLREYTQLEEAFVASQVFFRSDKRAVDVAAGAVKDDGSNSSAYSCDSAASSAESQEDQDSD